MGEEFAKLLDKIAAGECIVGTFVRRAVEENNRVMFAELIVHLPNGQTYFTSNPWENERFFDVVDYRGIGVDSGFSRDEKRDWYESRGYWHKT